MKYSGWPEPGELVVCEVTEVEDFGAFVDLVEYEDKEGLIHVSEVASGWVKYIRDHVREGQTVVCKVLEVDEDSQQIDLSAKDVNDHQRQEKIQEWKNETKADNWLSREFEDDDEYREVAEALIARYGTMYEALEEGAVRGEEVFEDAGIVGDRSETLTEIARDNINVPYVEVTGYVDVETTAADGVDDVIEALSGVETPEYEEADGDVEVEIEYVSAPEYRITAKAHDYKTAQRAVEDCADEARDRIENLGGRGEYHEEPHTSEA
ncbi:MAG: translation initiation factor IF-2 subunit alpha [Halobacteriales archaeon]